MFYGIIKRLLRSVNQIMINDGGQKKLSIGHNDFLKLNDDLRTQLTRHQIFVKWSIIDNIERDAWNVGSRIRQCPLCEYKASEDNFLIFESHCRFGGGKLIRFQCPSCDLIFGADKIMKLTESELAEEYEWHYRVYSEGDSTENEIRAFQSLDPITSGIYLNYGAGQWSKSVQVLRNDGWNIYGYEPHAIPGKESQFIVSDRDKLSGMKFDGIYSNNLLEHLRNPVDELVFMRSLLNNGAMMSHATPCFEYLYEFTRFHLFFYLGNSREIIANKAGLKLVNFIKDNEFINAVYKPEILS